MLAEQRAHKASPSSSPTRSRRATVGEAEGRAVDSTRWSGIIEYKVDTFFLVCVRLLAVCRQGRDELVVYHSMWYDGAPHQGQCEGCTFNLWHLKDAVYLNARGVSFAVLTSGPWDEVAPYVEFMGYTQPWYSVRGVEAPLFAEEGHIICFLRDDDRVFLTYSTTGRGNEPVDASLGLLDMTPLRPPRGVGGQPRGLARGPAGRLAGRWAWLADLLVLALGRRRRRQLGADRPARAAVDPPRRDRGGDPRPARPPPLTGLDLRTMRRPPALSSVAGSPGR